MTETGLSKQERITKWVESWVAAQKMPGVAAIEPLAGDGSLRTYYRLRVGDASFVLLADPQWTSSKDYAPHQVYLSSRQVPVPRFLTTDPNAGFGVMEDLGDELLQERLRRVEKDPAQKLRWLKSATELLANLHGGTYPVPRDLPVSTRRFDAQKYFEELQFTFEHLHRKYLGLEGPTDAQLKSLRQFCEELDRFTPDVFCHRDYHTRNLLVVGEGLFMIDFQDARLGPVQYDLASLLYDAYVPVSPEERRTLWSYYKEVLRRYPLHDAVDWKGFEGALEKVAFQRVVKAAGSFASFFTRYGKTTHLPYLLPALRSAKALKVKCDAMDLDRWIALVEKKGKP